MLKAELINKYKEVICGVYENSKLLEVEKWKQIRKH